MYVLDFKTSDRKLFFWMQEPSGEKDKENVEKLNKIIANGGPLEGDQDGSFRPFHSIWLFVLTLSQRAVSRASLRTSSFCRRSVRRAASTNRSCSASCRACKGRVDAGSRAALASRLHRAAAARATRSRRSLSQRRLPRRRINPARQPMWMP